MLGHIEDERLRGELLRLGGLRRGKNARELVQTVRTTRSTGATKIARSWPMFRARMDLG